MSDNVPITAGSGTTVATDDVSTVHFQKVKLADGTADSSAMIGGDATNGLDVDVTRVSGGAVGHDSPGTSQNPLLIGGYASAAAPSDVSADGDAVRVWFDRAGRLTTRRDSVTVSGTLGALNDTVALALDGRDAVVFEIVGGLTGSVEFDFSRDGGTTWYNGLFLYWIMGASVPQYVAYVTSPFSGCIFVGHCGGYTHVRMKVAAYTSDSTTATITAGYGNAADEVMSPGDTGTGQISLPGRYAFAMAWSGTAWTRLRTILVGDAFAGTGLLGAGLFGYNGSTYDRLRSDTTNGLDVDVTRVSGDVSVVGKAADGAAVAGNPVLIAGQDGTNAQSIKTDADGELQVDVLTLPAITGSVTANAGTNLNTSALALESGGNLAGAATSLAVMDDWDNAASDGASVSGDVAHGATDAGEPVKVGAVAIAHGSNPSAVTAGQRTNLYANRAGIPFHIGGHPNVVTLKHTTITTAVTDAAIITVSTGTKIVVTAFTVTLDNASTVFPTFLMGFGVTNTPTTTGVLGAHGGVPAGGGFSRGDGSGILGIGADNEDLRVTTTGNATGNGLQIVVTYYTIDS